MMKNLNILALAILLASCFPKEVEQSNGTNVSRWNLSANPFPQELSISTDFASDEIDAIEDMALNWDNEVNSGIQFFDTTGTVSPKSNDLNTYQDGRMGVYRINSWPTSLPADALAVTQIFGTRRNIGSASEYIEINHADILVNYDNFTFSTDGSSGYDFQTVLTHEMGHFLGLFHNDTSRSESVMYRSIGRFTNNRVPKARDASDIKTLYGITGSGAQQSSAGRGIASSNNTLAATAEDEITEEVVVLFELKADGQERVTIKNKDGKLIKSINTGCEH